MRRPDLRRPLTATVGTHRSHVEDMRAPHVILVVSGRCRVRSPAGAQAGRRNPFQWLALVPEHEGALTQLRGLALVDDLCRLLGGLGPDDSPLLRPAPAAVSQHDERVRGLALLEGRVDARPVSICEGQAWVSDSSSSARAVVRRRARLPAPTSSSSATPKTAADTTA